MFWMTLLNLSGVEFLEGGGLGVFGHLKFHLELQNHGKGGGG